MTPYDHVPSEPSEGQIGEEPVRNASPGASANLEARRAALIRKIGLGAGAVLVLFVLVGALQHYLTHRSALAAMEARLHAVPEVRVEPVKMTQSTHDLKLPGNTSAIEGATIFARQSGYVAKRVVDIGSRVKTGDLLALITAPEIDDQLAQAQAQLTQMDAALKQAEANRALAQATDRRTATLVEKGWQSQQQGDTDRLNLKAQDAAVNVARANLAAQQAQVARLAKEQDYERVVAPFDGVITQRSIDTGSLVTADASSGTPMFAIARTNVLRVQVYVPQDAAFGVKEGVAATIDVPEFKGREFHGRVARTAEALQAGTRTLLAEVDIDNPDGALTAGLYCSVRLALPSAGPAAVIPADALIVDGKGTQVAVFENGHARIRKVAIAEDDGASVTIATGLQDGDQVIVGLPVDIADGDAVAIRQPTKPGAAAGP